MQGGRLIETNLGQVKLNVFASDNNASSVHTAARLQMLEVLPVAVYICDTRGLITFYNKAAAQLWGRIPEAGKDVWCGAWNLYDVDGSVMLFENSPLAVTVQTKKPLRCEMLIERVDGSKCHVMAYPEPLFDGSGRITGAINTLIDITELVGARRTNNKISEPAIASFNLRELIEGMVGDVHKNADAKNISLELDFDKRLEKNYIGDAGRIAKIINTLLANAVRFTARGSIKLIVGLNKRTDDSANITVHIVDTGIGIAADALANIFEQPGLSNCRKLAQSLGADITVESREKYGCEFTLRISLLIDHYETA